MRQATPLAQLQGRDRLIVALDVDSVARATQLVDEVTNVTFFKVGWRLLMAGLRQNGLGDFFDSLQRDRKTIFIDLKVPDIGNTIASVVADLRDDTNVWFLTLHEDMQVDEIRMARGARGHSATPKLLTVPFRSSLDESDYPQVAAPAAAKGITLNQWILARAGAALEGGCDGLIVSGTAIALCRKTWPRSSGVQLVSPGIRPAGTSRDDHKRSTTPAEAILRGADYLVVGRPILDAPDRVRAAQEIIDEIDRTLETLPVEDDEPEPVAQYG